MAFLEKVSAKELDKTLKDILFKVCDINCFLLKLSMTMKFNYFPKNVWQVGGRPNPQNTPFYIDKAEDSFIYDMKGRKIIDFSMGQGSVTLGHANARLKDILLKQISRGQQYTFLPASYEQLAKSFSSLFGNQLRKSIFLKNGSDAVRLAMRVARAYTQKEIIFTCGYHSWQDEFLSDFWPRDGAIKSSHTINFYYDLDKLESLVKKHKGNISAILVTPEPGLLPYDFYKNLKSICQANDSLFIMDEIKCGYHEEILGLSGLVELDPDILLLSKGMANGYPISAVIGYPKVMDSSDQSVIFGTYFYDAYGFPLALETLKIYQEQEVISRLKKIGEKLTIGASELFNITKTRARVTGSYSLPIFLFENKEEEHFFFEELFKKNILIFPNDHIGLSITHKDQIISYTLNIIEDILRSKPNKFLKYKGSAQALDVLSMKKMISRKALEPQWIGLK